jgi:hypothetical protein
MGHGAIALAIAEDDSRQLFANAAMAASRVAV